MAVLNSSVKIGVVYDDRKVCFFLSSQIFFLLSDFSHHMLRAHGARRRGRGLQVAGCAGKALAGWDAGLARGLRASTGACAGRRTLASCCSGPARLLLPLLPPPPPPPPTPEPRLGASRSPTWQPATTRQSATGEELFQKRKKIVPKNKTPSSCVRPFFAHPARPL